MAVFNKESLLNLLTKGKLELRLFLDLAIEISKSLNELHAVPLVHQHLRPESILINWEPLGVELVNEGEFKEHRRVNINSQAYYYQAPEQTGRVLRKIDSRTDLYTLGVIFYELLTGTRPFESDDYVDVIYYHLAREAEPVEQVNPQIPRVLSDIIAKLMQKKMENRYQTAAGLLADLDMCRNKLGERGGMVVIPAFQLGRYDFTQELLLPQKVLGRESELAQLLKAFEQAKLGQARMIFVTGYSGVGKTTLVNEIRIPVQSSGGLFIQGKFDQFKKSIPYHSFIQAFDQLFQKILSQSKEKIQSWKERVHKALAENGKIITDIFPKLEGIIGPQDSVESLPVHEAQYRFQRVFIQFLQAIATKSAPLVLFLDDLQWADIHSIKLLELIFKEKEKLHLLLIGAYRDNEVMEPHPLAALIEKIHHLYDKRIEVISLNPLNLNQVRQQVRHILGREDELAELFARLCSVKTGGNPFFLNQFIQSLKDDGLIFYSPEQKNWEVSMDQILDRSVTDNVIDLMVKKIEKLPHLSIEILKWASCINNTFDIETLAHIQGLSEEDVLKTINEAIKEGLVVYQEIEQEGVSRLEYRFLHDRVQQAANSLLRESTQKEICFRLGQWFLKNNSELTMAENLLEITDYLNCAEERVKESNETELLARLNIEAGKRAKRASAHESALDYLRRGMTLLGNEVWESNYDMALELYTEGTESAYLCGDHVLVDQYAEEVISQGKTLLDKAATYIIKIESYTVQNRLGEAIETAREILSLLGIRIPQKPSRVDIMWNYLQIKHALLGRNFEDLKNMPEMKDNTFQMIMKILISAGISAYSSSPLIFVMIAMKIVLISLKQGMTPATPIAYCAYGHFLCTYFDKRELGYQFGKLAIELQDRMKSKVLVCKTHLIFEILVRHQQEPIRNTLKGFPKHHELGLNEGDLISAGHIMMQYFVYLYLAGRKLSDIKEVMEEYKEVLQRTGNTTSIMVCLMYLQGHVNLLESAQEPWQLQGEYFQELEELPLYKDANDRTITFNTYFYKMILSYLSGANIEALNYLDIVEEYLDGAIGTFCIPVYHFYSVLVRLENLERLSPGEKKLQQRRYRTSMRKLQRFQEAAPENIKNKYSLLRAEIARTSENTEKTLKYYDQSIRAARENGFLPEEALANELAARYAVSTGLVRLAEGYVREAMACYSAWGWVQKAEKLQEKYRDITQDKDFERYSEIAVSREPQSSQMFQMLDVDTIIRASQALSEEIVLQDLLKKMIRLVLQNSGARRASLLLEKDGELYIEAEGYAERDEVVLSQGELTRSKEQLAEKILNYVVNTHECVVLNTEEEIQQFMGDSLPRGNTAKSLLCMPVESKRNLVGILYLENDLIDGAFSGQHLSVLKILASQLAISIENARLYLSLEKRVEERTAQLENKNSELQEINIKLEQANHAKSDFLAKMSHEMRTPLHGILGMAGLIQKGSLLPEQREHLKAVVDSGQVLLEIINEILDSSKVEAKGIELEERDFDLKLLIDEMLPSFLVKAEDKGLHLEVALDTGFLSGLRGDPLRIKQILSNLLSNAIKFTEKGQVIVRFSLEEQEVAQNEGSTVTLEIRVEDTGIGIPEDKIDYIFEDFTQVDSSISRKYEGTGLGLAITKKIIELKNGSITVKSHLGQGSIFQCRIPLKWARNKLETNSVNKRITQMNSTHDVAKLSILVVEDDVISGKYLEAFLKYLGCNVTVVSNGFEVLEELQAREYDCVIMDKNMPELDGIETTRRIRRKETTTGKHLPIIALTASALAGDREKLLDVGMDYFLTKPIQETQLIAILGKINQEISIASTQESQFIERSVFLEEAALYGEDVILDIVQQFLTEYESNLILLEETIQQADFENARKNAHRFASTLSIFHSPELVLLAQNLERWAQEQETERLREGLTQLKAKIEVFVVDLTEIMKILEAAVQP